MRIPLLNLPGSPIACLIVLLSAAPFPAIDADETEYIQTINLEYAPAPADNPLKGFVPFRGDYGTVGAGEESTAFPHSVEWAYFPLSAVMTAANEFDFDSEFTPVLDEIAGRRHQAALRFYLDYPAKPTGVPQFLIDAGLAMTPYDDYGGGASPDYSDEKLIVALETFVAAFGKKFDADPRIAFVTLGLLGFWGEWHTHPHDEWFPPQKTQQRILRAWTSAFSENHLLMRTPQPDATQWPIGLHDDSFAYTTLGPEEWHFLPTAKASRAGELWRRHPIGGEVRPEGQALFWPTDPPAKVDDEIEIQDFNECVQHTHASWLINQHVFSNYSQLSEDARKRAVAAARSLGYELHISTATFPKSAQPGASVAISINIENRGVAPFYQYWPIELKLGSLRHTSGWSLNEIQPDADEATNWTTSLKLPSDFTAGDYRLEMRAIPPLENGLPLRFANKEQQANGWILLGNFSVSTGKQKARRR